MDQLRQLVEVIASWFRPDNLATTSAWIFFVFTTVAVFVTWFAAILLRPRTKFEWATLGLLSSFVMVTFRSLALAALNRRGLMEPWGTIFWVIQAILVGYYLYQFWQVWKVMLVRGATFAWTGRARFFVVAAIGGFLLLMTLLLAAAYEKRNPPLPTPTPTVAPMPPITIWAQTPVPSPTTQPSEVGMVLVSPFPEAWHP